MKTRSSAMWSALSAIFLGLGAPASGQFLYVPDYNQSGLLNAYRANLATGALNIVPGSPFPTGSFPGSVTVDPTGKFAYTTNAGSDNVSAYVINQSTGALTPVPGTPFASGSEPVDIAVDPSGRFAYVANFISGNVWAYSIDAISGALTPIPGSPFAAGPFLEGVAVHPTGKFLYVTVSYNGQMPGIILGYAINPTTGALTPVAPSAGAGSFPIPVTVDPTGMFAYAGSGGNVFGYGINPVSGGLTAIPGSPFASGQYPASLAVDPTGRFLYATDFMSSTMSAYDINDSTGVLTPISGSPFPVGPAPRAVRVDSTGSFAFVVLSNNGIGIGSVAAFAINSITGALTPAGSPVAAGNFPIAIAVTRCTAPPTIAGLITDPSLLWPPNGKMVNVAIKYTATSSCGGIPVCAVSITSNETSTSPEWTVIGSDEVALRAERNGNGTGRVYSISVMCRDAQGNSSSQTTTVQVPHDLR